MKNVDKLEPFDQPTGMASQIEELQAPLNFSEFQNK
jgi:hypothetical protein